MRGALYFYWIVFIAAVGCASRGENDDYASEVNCRAASSASTCNWNGNTNLGRINFTMPGTAVFWVLMIVKAYRRFLPKSMTRRQRVAASMWKGAMIRLEYAKFREIMNNRNFEDPFKNRGVIKLRGFWDSAFYYLVWSPHTYFADEHLYNGVSFIIDTASAILTSGRFWEWLFVLFF